jgi:RNA polymerase sigma-70 factor (ECF subfamily)
LTKKKQDIVNNSPSEKLYADFDREAVPHMKSLLNFALKLTKDEEDANDLLQETYLRAFRFFDKFEKGTNCKAWLYRIMKNTFINDYRKILKEPNKVDYEDIQNFYETIKSNEVETRHYEEDAFAGVLDDDITAAIASLSEDFRTVIILSDIEGFTYEEIADFVDAPVGTVRSRIHRARKMLYSKLHGYAVKNGFIKDVA